jgi:hypothetical protein
MSCPQGSFFIYLYKTLMKYILPLIFCFPALVQAQAPARPRLLQGFAQAGYVNELWVVSHNVANGYTAQSYGGNGAYLGGGLRTRMDSTKRLGYALSADYVGYSMAKLLATNEGAQRRYAFIRFVPAVNYMIKSRGLFTFVAQANASYMVAVRNNQNSYLQYGLKGMLGWKAYEASVGFNFSQGKKLPSGDISGSWHEQSFNLGVACYPGLIPGFSHKSKSSVRH